MTLPNPTSASKPNTTQPHASNTRLQIALRAQVFTASPESIMLLDTQGCIVDWNPAAAALFGYAPAEALG